jgi:hypothetical protein
MAARLHSNNGVLCSLFIFKPESTIMYHLPTKYRSKSFSSWIDQRRLPLAMQFGVSTDLIAQIHDGDGVYLSSTPSVRSSYARFSLYTSSVSLELSIITDIGEKQEYMHSYAMMSDVTNGYCLSQGTND